MSDLITAAEHEWLPQLKLALGSFSADQGVTLRKDKVLALLDIIDRLDRATRAAAQERGLDVAWRECEAARPQGGRLLVGTTAPADTHRGPFVAEYLPPFAPYDAWKAARGIAWGATPAEALDALTAALTALRATDVPSAIVDDRPADCQHSPSSDVHHRRATDVPSDPDQPDPIETFSHPFVGPVVIDGHLLTHTSDCAWPLDVEAEGRATDAPVAEGLDAERLAEAMRSCDGVDWPKGWRDAEHNFDWVARQIAAAYRRGTASEPDGGEGT